MNRHDIQRWDVVALEAEIAARSTPFGCELARRWQEFQEWPVLPTVWRLDTWLADIASDKNPYAVQIDFVHSRGKRMVPRHARVLCLQVYLGLEELGKVLMSVSA
eukprot:COSAG01_NODE_30677_length_611_cov_1.603516_1_plen_105_part_00